MRAYQSSTYTIEKVSYVIGMASTKKYSGAPNNGPIFFDKYHLFQARKDATQVVANLQRQQVQSRLIASDYLEANLDLMDILIAG